MSNTLTFTYFVLFGTDNFTGKSSTALQLLLHLSSLIKIKIHNWQKLTPKRFKSISLGLAIAVRCLKTHFVTKDPLKLNNAINIFLVKQNIILYYP